MSISFDQRNSIRFRKNNLPGYASPMSFSMPAAGIKLFLDMDGVLTDFTGACEQLGEHMMSWYVSDKDRFWKRVTEAGVGFWSNMPWLEGGRELHGFLKCCGFSPTILSALPNPDRKAALTNARKGKISWLRQELGPAYANEAILCFRPEKALHSAPSRVLIDDNSENISEWIDAGGVGILHKNTPRTIRCLSKVIEIEQKS